MQVKAAISRDGQILIRMGCSNSIRHSTFIKHYSHFPSSLHLNDRFLTLLDSHAKFLSCKVVSKMVFTKSRATAKRGVKIELTM